MTISITTLEERVLQQALIATHIDIYNQYIESDDLHKKAIIFSYVEHIDSQYGGGANPLYMLEKLDVLIDKLGIAEYKKYSKKGDTNFSQVLYDETKSDKDYMKIKKNERPYSAKEMMKYIDDDELKDKFKMMLKERGIL